MVSPEQIESFESEIEGAAFTVTFIFSVAGVHPPKL